MAQIFRSGANTLVRLCLVALVVLPPALVLFGYVLSASAHLTGQGETVVQPVPLSHQHHVGGLGLDCRYCPDSAGKSAFAGMPPTETCMTCHSQLWIKARMLAPVRESLESGIGLRRNRVNDLADYVYFNHAAHVNNGVGCTTCHGPVDRMPLTFQAAPLTMGWCLSCHRDPAPNLRPPDQIYATDWREGEEPEAHQNLMRRYGIDTTLLEDCSVCHR